MSRDTIAAIATAAGSAGVGIVRLSGPDARRVGEAIAQRTLTPRRAHHVQFRSGDDVIDDGLALLFVAPASYTGEDVVELQAHGSPAVLAQLLDACLALGARPARPGEFTERAFLEGRLDLAQAEAVADLIAAADVRAARAARRALDGDFSRRVDAIAAQLLHVRVHCEAAIDFADEPIDTLGGDDLRRRLDAIERDLDALLVAAEQGRRLRDGLHAVIVGPPNAGKSSVLNALAGVDRAIVTDIAGTTRDVLRETVRIEGVELTLVDTAGLRDSGDAIEREGMRRAHAELERADLAIVVVDARDAIAGHAAVANAITGVPHVLRIANKTDLLDAQPPDDFIAASAHTGIGLDDVRRRLHALALGPNAETAQGAFSARTRHVHALNEARDELAQARVQLAHEHLDLAAEQLRRAHDALGAITGRVHADDLLGHIFSSFCIGK
ncbi:tRNA uridine-5-carboxymethylaminomethyl(34) synthesis GTPase MnmE [Lysobacter claricitrinus]|uniref:tRNA uridine-5-carboxymethylaminomethyl(34) synthesis GTPase MnmE n=1 Tax=Lysobacter claricitrinus TaxID=3367728 RepID=UPI0037DBE7C7